MEPQIPETSSVKNTSVSRFANMERRGRGAKNF